MEFNAKFYHKILVDDSAYDTHKPGNVLDSTYDTHKTGDVFDPAWDTHHQGNALDTDDEFDLDVLHRVANQGYGNNNNPGKRRRFRGRG